MEDSAFATGAAAALTIALSLQASWFFYSLNPCSKSPEPPRKVSNPSPKPVPKRRGVATSDEFERSHGWSASGSTSSSAGASRPLGASRPCRESEHRPDARAVHLQRPGQALRRPIDVRLESCQDRQRVRLRELLTCTPSREGCSYGPSVFSSCCAIGGGQRLRDKEERR